MIDMSVIYCEVCCEHIDTDFQAEHFDDNGQHEEDIK